MLQNEEPNSKPETNQEVEEKETYNSKRNDTDIKGEWDWKEEEAIEFR